MRMARDIDWLAVDMVAYEGRTVPLKSAERRAVIRRVKHRMLKNNESSLDLPPGVLTARMLAERMATSAREVQRIVATQKPATKKPCPVCRQSMWVLDDGTVEQHPNSLNETCEMSLREMQTVRGLARIRPDLYRWLEFAS